MVPSAGISRAAAIDPRGGPAAKDIELVKTYTVASVLAKRESLTNPPKPRVERLATADMSEAALNWGRGPGADKGRGGGGRKRRGNPGLAGWA